MSAIARRSEARQTSEISTLSAVTPEGLDSHLRSHSELGSPDADSARVLLHLSRSLPQLSSLFPPLEDADSWPDKPTRPPPRRPRRSSSLPAKPMSAPWPPRLLLDPRIDRAMRHGIALPPVSLLSSYPYAVSGHASGPSLRGNPIDDRPLRLARMLERGHDAVAAVTGGNAHSLATSMAPKHRPGSSRGRSYAMQRCAGHQAKLSKRPPRPPRVR